MSESASPRLSNTGKTPVAGAKPAESPALELRRRQRRLVIVTIAVVLVIVAGVGVFNYIEDAPQRADREYQEGMKMMRPGQYPAAIAHFTRALANAAQLSDAYLQRGNALRSTGEPDAALADYRAAADLDPSMAEAHNGIAMIYLQRRDSPHALEELNKSIALRPTIEAYYQRGEILDSQGDHRKAIDDYDLAIAIARDAPDVYLARASAKASLGDLEGAHADRVLANQLQK